MEGYDAWHKYQNQAAIYVLRWDAQFTNRVLSSLYELLQPYRRDGEGETRDAISAMLILNKQNPSAPGDFGQQANITEKQVWALLITTAEQETTSLDRLSDAYDQIRRLDSQEQSFMQQKMLPNFQYGSAERQRQSARATKPRKKISDDAGAVTIGEIVYALATTHHSLKAKELWPMFIGELDKLNLDPEEDDAIPGTLRCRYYLMDEVKYIAFEHFSNLVSRARKKNSF